MPRIRSPIAPALPFIVTVHCQPDGLYQGRVRHKDDPPGSWRFACACLDREGALAKAWGWACQRWDVRQSTPQESRS